MPSRIKLSRQRAEISRLVLSLLRLSTTYNPSNNYGATITDALICTAIYIGQFEGKPMSPGKLSTYTGIPRATVVRHLDTLLASGRIEKPDGTYQLPIDALNHPDVVAMISEAERLILRTSALLSKMDTKPLATLLGVLYV